MKYHDNKNNKNVYLLRRIPFSEAIYSNNRFVIETNLLMLDNSREVMFLSIIKDWPVTSETITKWIIKNLIIKKTLGWVHVDG